MEKLFGVLQLLICGSVWISVNCQLASCTTPICNCCKDQVCASDDFCTNGCIDGIWGNKCYNSCPTDCVSCTHGSMNGGEPCITCNPGKYSGTYQDKTESWRTNYTDCSLDCKSSCVSCTSYNNCNECVPGRYGVSCKSFCYIGCDGDSCDKADGKCNCKTGFTNLFCKQCALNEYGQYPSCFACPDKCLTCSSSSACYTCKSGYYNGYNVISGSTVSDCTNPCRSTCITCSSYDVCGDCENGFWGQTCVSICSTGCMGGFCEKDNGQCFCKSLFKGDKCDHCNAGRYGNECDKACLSQNCKNNECSKLNGICSLCKVGYFGNSQCDKSCSSGCNNYACDFNDGQCTSGCVLGYSGDKCCLENSNCETCSSTTQCLVCKSGFSGDKCCVNNDRCITCSSLSTCSLCMSGYSGDKCCLANNFCDICSSNTVCSKCKDGRYGTMCTDTCPDNCANTFCKNDGSCSSCKSGFHGNNCENECPQNYDECNENMECIKCTAGYFGSNCDRCSANCTSCSSLSYCDACYQGFYGSYCQSKCSNCKEGTNCFKSNGYCEEACKDGVYGPNCNSNCNNNCAACQRDSASRCTLCANGRYGKNNWDTYYQCNTFCSSNCYYKLCNASTGYCDKCIEGYKGDYCDCPVNCQCTDTGKCGSCVDNFANTDKNCTECALNLYGVDCQTECNNNCLDNDQNTKCHGTNGTCIVGCANGFYGEKCDIPCDQNCLNGICARLNGICSYGCKDGFTDSGAICVMAEASLVGSGAVIGGFVGGVIWVLIIVGFLAYVIHRRRRVSKDNVQSAPNYVNTRPEASAPEVETTPDYEELNEVPPNMQISAPDIETTHEYEELDVAPQNMQRSCLSTDHIGDGVVVETGTINTYESLSRPDMNTHIYNQLEQST